MKSYGHEEFKNVNHFAVQKAHKAERAGQYLRPMQRRIVPSMEIRVHLRRRWCRRNNLQARAALCVDCTNGGFAFLASPFPQLLAHM